MIRYSNEQLATIIALPTITILLIWTIAIFHKNREKWGPYDIPIVSVLVLSVLRNITVISYLLINTLGNPESFSLEYCSVVVWVFNSIHTFQASSLTTIAVIGLFSVRLHRKQQNLKHFLTPTHIIYHLFCLTTLCACVGVAAILGQNESDIAFANVSSYFQCKFMPFNLDIKFNVFILVLHLFLAVISFSSFLIICFNFFKAKRRNFEYLKKSNSDLSDLSVGNTLNNDQTKNYYDTYTIQRVNHNIDNNFYDANQPQHHTQNGFCRNRDINWNSDLSNLSTTVSSTNSRRPCLIQNIQMQGKEKPEENRTGLETIHPVLIVCYLFYHLPLIVLCIYPYLIHPWPVSGIALWLGLIQDLLIPIGLGIVDSRFCKWVSSVYRCSGNSVEEKLPHVGLDGKFRPFGTSSQPQSLDTTDSDRNRVFQAVEHRFPITNGSLYTSIDGRLPVIHNYRRNRDNKGTKQTDKQSPTVAFLSPHLARQDYNDPSGKFPSCSNCEADLCPSHSNLHHLSPQYINKQLNLLQHSHNLMLTKRSTPEMRMAHSQESLNFIPELQNRQLFCRNSDLGLNSGNNLVMKSSRNLLRLNKMRLSRSEDSLNELQVRELGNIIHLSRQKTSESNRLTPQHQQSNKTFTRVEVNTRNEYSSSDDDYLTDINDTNNNNDRLDSMSLQSCCSITTEANCDFEFYQNNQQRSGDIPRIDTCNSADNSNEFFVIHNVNNRPVMTSFKPVPPPRMSSQTELDRNFRITRSNSKRSLENFQAFIEVEHKNLDNNLKRSNSFMTLEDRYKSSSNEKNIMASPKITDSSRHFNNFRPKIKSVEYLPDSNTSTVFIEDANSNNIYFREEVLRKSNDKCVSSVPDLQRVFVSEYI
ncbi:uncharacterized protein [Leptinotarsa decemlineata]|uniref:uncharacterized protein n=1 Tax=Leptinotarsa decemlineata TaxID=7539 RepID=UPI003D305DF8